MVLTLEQKEAFYRRRKKIGKTIVKVVKKRKMIIFGARSVNRQVPEFLREHTADYDIFSQGDPKKAAKRIERKLDKKFPGNAFEVKPAKHEGTFKVINRVTKKGLIDVSKKPKGLKTVKRKGVHLASLEFQKQKIKQSLADPESKFRHQKDKNTRLRIKLAEKKRLRKRKRGSRKMRDFKVPKINVPNLFKF